MSSRSGSSLVSDLALLIIALSYWLGSLALDFARDGESRTYALLDGNGVGIGRDLLVTVLCFLYLVGMKETHQCNSKDE